MIKKLCKNILLILGEPNADTFAKRGHSTENDVRCTAAELLRAATHSNSQSIFQCQIKNPPANDKEGLINAVTIIAMHLEGGDTQEARYGLCNLLDDLSSDRVKFSWDRVVKFKKTPSPGWVGKPPKGVSWESWLVANNVD